jgi:formamidopyrimidine-DNA glycosylase
MPELPEVEATRQNLERWTRGRPVIAVRGDAAHALAPLVGRQFTGWQRRGKTLLGLTDEPALNLSAHLGMTGRWVRDPAANRPHVRAALDLEGTTIAFCDVRRFGRVALIPREDAFVGLGPDALEGLSADRLRASMGAGKAPLKVRLMDQARVAGLGNIAVLEAAYRAGIHPHVPIGALAQTHWEALAHAIADHLRETLAGCVNEDEITYVSEGGDNPFLVYGREGEPCGLCRTLIVRAVLQGRPSFWCPTCQLDTCLENRDT